jgi:hypothetical protein
MLAGDFSAEQNRSGIVHTAALLDGSLPNGLRA